MQRQTPDRCPQIQGVATYAAAGIKTLVVILVENGPLYSSNWGALGVQRFSK